MPWRGSKQMSRPRAEAALSMLLASCTAERLRGFTTESREWQSILASHNVPQHRAEALLAEVKARRL